MPSFSNTALTNAAHHSVRTGSIPNSSFIVLRSRLSCNPTNSLAVSVGSPAVIDCSQPVVKITNTSKDGVSLMVALPQA